MLLRPVEIDRALVTNGEWLEFMQDGGYAKPELWLSDGFVAVQTRAGRRRATGGAATACGRA